MLQVVPGRATPFVGGGPFRIRLMRPRLVEADLEPLVQFHERPAITRGEWTQIGGPFGSGAPLTIRNRVNVYDAHLKAGDRITAPSAQGWRQWLYVMHGTVEVGNQSLAKGDAVADTAS